MTGYGKLNLLAMLALPAAATVAALIVFGPLPATLFTVFGLNLAVTLVGSLFAALLLWGARKARQSGSVALWPSVVPALCGAVWYLWRAASPETVAPGREYLAGPQYLLLMAVALFLLAAAWIVFRLVAGRTGRSRSAD